MCFMDGLLFLILLNTIDFYFIPFISFWAWSGFTLILLVILFQVHFYVVISCNFCCLPVSCVCTQTTKVEVYFQFCYTSSPLSLLLSMCYNCSVLSYPFFLHFNISLLCPVIYKLLVISCELFFNHFFGGGNLFFFPPIKKSIFVRIEVFYFRLLSQSTLCCCWQTQYSIPMVSKFKYSN